MYTRTDNSAVTEVSPSTQNAVMVLSKPIDFKLLRLLFMEGPMPFSRLKKSLRLQSIVLDRCLKRLMNGALITNYYTKSKDARTHSYYEASSLAQDLYVVLSSLGQPVSIFATSDNPFYKPGPDITEDVQTMGKVIDRMCRNLGIKREVNIDSI